VSSEGDAQHDIGRAGATGGMGGASDSGPGASADADAAAERYPRTREKLQRLLADGQLEGREVEVEVSAQRGPMFDMLVPQGAPEGMENFNDMLQDMLPKRRRVHGKGGGSAADPAGAGEDNRLGGDHLPRVRACRCC
jgi:hypothetical protein